MVQINISGETAAEALKDLATLAAGFNGAGSVNKIAVTDKTDEPADEKTTTTTRKKKVADKKVETEEADESGDAVSLEMVQAKMKQILAPVTGTPGEKELRAKIKGVFGDFGAVSTSTIKEADYAKVIEAMEELVDDLD